MSATQDVSPLGDGLLGGVTVVLSGGDEMAGTLRGLGASIGPSPGQAMVHDTRPRFGSGGREALTACLAETWEAVQRTAAEGWIPAERDGRIVLVAPRADAGDLAEGARAALENLARTLSIEWARYGITTVAIAPGPSVSDSDLAQIVAFVLSDAGAYLSGCRLSLV